MIRNSTQMIRKTRNIKESNHIDDNLVKVDANNNVNISLPKYNIGEKVWYNNDDKDASFSGYITNAYYSLCAARWHYTISCGLDGEITLFDFELSRSKKY